MLMLQNFKTSLWNTSACPPTPALEAAGQLALTQQAIPWVIYSTCTTVPLADFLGNAFKGRKVVHFPGDHHVP